MKRTSIVWVLATACVVVVLAAIGVITASVLDRKQQDLKQGAEAYREERIRLAMWRLDTLAAAIVGEEDKRPAEEFELPPILAPVDDKLQTLNPLYAGAPEHSNLYWVVNSNSSSVTTPQVYPEQVIMGNGVDPAFNAINEQNYERVSAILSNRLDMAIKGDLPFCDTNKDLSCQAVHLVLPKQVEQKSQLVKGAKEDFSLQNVKGKEKGEEVVKMVNKAEVQQKLSEVDTRKRRSALNRVSENYAWGPQANLSTQLNTNDQVTEVTQFRPIWLDGELMLVRKVVRQSGESVQGVWLNSKKIKQLLLDEVADLFPQASLIPVAQDLRAILSGEEIVQDPQTMLKLPYRLSPGERAEVSLSLIDLLKGPIGLAWAGTLLAIVAGFFMLRSVVQMSERRASFVSAVTHELRTPLTTFRLYTDMLSSGMVKDEEKKESYLETLRRESERLTHLVENVLAYSRIERGSARARIEEVGISSLMERMLGRLRERAGDEQMEVLLSVDPVSSKELVKLDITAVEQIVFNLVDNAVKYASGEDCGSEIRIHAVKCGENFRISVTDQGKGIPAKERKRLFNAFHKSAEEAAVTKPGVGLGLALCRRLAQAMGGNLLLEKGREGEGATFVLTLPQKK
ncbi:sensor histidine kinase [Rubritalea halochordaticola]|uniref:sensor histidine kinase n=1 Tax=Rubritalea halochordaticola TaxID=714537 RepID=UPI0031FCB18F